MLEIRSRKTLWRFTRWLATALALTAAIVAPARIHVAGFHCACDAAERILYRVHQGGSCASHRPACGRRSDATCVLARTPSREADLSLPKIDRQGLIAQEVQAQQPIDARARRKCVAEDW